MSFWTCSVLESEEDSEPVSSQPTEPETELQEDETAAGQTEPAGDPLHDTSQQVTDAGLMKAL